MGGGGSGGTFVHRNPAELSSLVRREEDRTRGEAFGSELSTLLGGLLATYNGRDHQLVTQRLSELKEALQGKITGSFDQLFGGSVAKHTYVDGLSDIDSLVMLNESGLEGKSPESALKRMTKIIARAVDGGATVSHGRMAVTVDYPDGMQIQLLPALATEGGKVQVPSSRRPDQWSHIDPVKFQKALTKRNSECAGKLVPTVKLAKAIIAQLPESQRLSGYHVEALGIAAFRGYQGPKTTAAMLPTFFEGARDLVLKPIKDRTGQSVHVDGYLGKAASAERQAASHVLGRIARRMRNATAGESTAQWRALFGLEG